MRDPVTARPTGTKPTAPTAATPGAPPSRWMSYAARSGPVLVPVAAVAVAGSWGLARSGSMGNDEVATRWAALLSLRELAHLVRHIDAVHGLYYLVMHCWTVLGSSPTVMRVPSVVAMGIAAGLAAVIGRRLTGSGWAGLFAGLIMAVTPSISYYAQTARSYAMVLAGVLAATLALLHALDAEKAGARKRSTQWWLAYGALVALSGYLNEMALLVLAAHAVTVLVARPGTATVRRWAAAAVCGAALVLPLLALSVRQHAAVSWIGRPDLASVRTLFRDYFGAGTAASVILLACAVIAVLPPPEAWRRANRAGAADTGPAGPGPGTEPPAAQRTGRVTLTSVAVPLLVVPGGLLLLESVVAPPLYVDRYVLYGEAGAALLAGAGAYRLGQWLASGDRPRFLSWVPGVAICLLALLLQLGPQHFIRTPQSRQYDFGGPSQYLAARAQQGDGVLFSDTLFRKAELGYPADFRKVTDFAVAVTPLQAGNFRGTDKPFSLTRPLMLSYQRIWVIGARPSKAPPGLFRQESAVLESDFSLAASHHFRGMIVTLWIRR
jgi:mannosyltransferase